jgi:hypothetical protein
MKITYFKRIICSVIVLLICFEAISTASNQVKTFLRNEAKSSGEYDTSISPELLYMMLSKARKLYPKEPDAEKKCLKLGTASNKYDKILRELWGKVGESVTKNTPIRKDFFSAYIQQVIEEVEDSANNKKINCQTLMLSNLLDDGEFSNNSHQKELRSIVDSFFPQPTGKKGGKNIITAFIGPHRDTPNMNLFSKLNGNS